MEKETIPFSGKHVERPQGRRKNLDKSKNTNMSYNTWRRQNEKKKRIILGRGNQKCPV